MFVAAGFGVACGFGSALWTTSFGAESFAWALDAEAAAATGGDFSAASKALNAAVASGSTAAHVFSKVSTSRRTRIRRVDASTPLSSIATMPLRRVWHVVSGEKFAR